MSNDPDIDYIGELEHEVAELKQRMANMSEQDLSQGLGGRAVVPRCGDCVHFEWEDPKLKFGECRRFPPTFRFKAVMATAGGTHAAEVAWPVLSKDAWCIGEFRLKPMEVEK